MSESQPSPDALPVVSSPTCDAAGALPAPLARFIASKPDRHPFWRLVAEAVAVGVRLAADGAPASAIDGWAAARLATVTPMIPLLAEPARGALAQMCVHTAADIGWTAHDIFRRVAADASDGTTAPEYAPAGWEDAGDPPEPAWIARQADLLVESFVFTCEAEGYPGSLDPVE